MDTMRAGRLVGRDRIEIGRFPVPAPGPGEVLVRTLGASICGSDLHIARAPLEADAFPLPPGFPGHESVGEVVESRSAEHRPGDRLLLTPSPSVSCAFADLQVVTGSATVPLAADSDPEAMLMAQQLGTAIFACKRFWPGPAAETATVIGAGSAGLHFTQLLRRAGFGRIIVADRHAHRLEMAQALGATHVVHAPEESVVDATLDLTGGAGADLVIEAAGRNASRAQAFQAVADSGRVGLFGLPEHGADMALPFGELFRRRPTIEISVGAQGEPGLASFREAVRAIAAGELEAVQLITHRLPIERLPEAFDLAREGADGAVKVAIGFP